MLAFIIWYITVTLIGLAIFPLAYRLLPALADRGYAFIRALGLLLWGYVFWLFGSLGISGNDLGGQFAALLVILLLSGWALRGLDRQELFAWLHRQRLLIIFVEVIFLLAFIGMALVRAANPDLVGTEKPMEIAFINAILRSSTFPPHDPWLSGYAISYYYFGYLLVAMLTRLAGVVGGVGFNLGLALVFSLTAIGAFGLVYDLLYARKIKKPVQQNDNRQNETLRDVVGSQIRMLLGSLLAPFFVLLAGNLEAALELLHLRGFLWQANGGGFWSWLGILDLNQPPPSPAVWPPRSWWWWRASRVLLDFDYAHQSREVIDEFPAFSYVLGDLHPHVLAMPFAFLAMSLALNLYLGGGQGWIGWQNLRLKISPAAFLLASICLGGMGFLNLWDFPIYVALFAGAFTLLHARQEGWNRKRLVEFLSLVISLGVVGFLLYLPFYASFSSQAGGFLPTLIYVTRGAQLWVMFGLFLLPLFAFLIYLWRKDGDWASFWKGFTLGIGTLLALSLLSLVLAAVLISLLPTFAALNPNSGDIGRQFLAWVQAPDWGSLLRASFVSHLAAPGGWITLVLLLVLAFGLLVRLGRLNLVDAFALLLIVLSAFLVLGPEFFYVRDQFVDRMNTIFKLYFQGWLMWGVAAAYGVSILLQNSRRIWAFAAWVGLIVLIGIAALFPWLGFMDKTNQFKGADGGYTLDGGAFLSRASPDEVSAIHWLLNAPFGVMVEAVRADGGEYSDFAEVSTYSGLPTVLGWKYHESQWRGGLKEVGSRQEDIQKLYTSRDWVEAQQILTTYDIRYIYVGGRERGTYHITDLRFSSFLKTAFKQGDVTIYEVP